MARPKKKRKGKIKVKQRMRLVHGNDATRVSKNAVDTFPRMPARPPADVAPTFRIKIRKKQ